MATKGLDVAMSPVGAVWSWCAAALDAGVSVCRVAAGPDALAAV
jgi:hypothetical protein